MYPGLVTQGVLLDHITHYSVLPNELYLASCSIKLRMAIRSFKFGVKHYNIKAENTKQLRDTGVCNFYKSILILKYPNIYIMIILFIFIDKVII